MIETVWEADTRQTEEFFRYAGYKARDMREPLQDAAEDLMRSIEDAFATEGASIFGSRWPEVTEAWRKRKDAKGGTAELLLRYTDRLIDAALDDRNVHVHMDHMLYVLRWPVWAGVHQYGWPGKHIPPRPFVVVTPELEEQTRQHFYWWLEETKAANVRRARISSVPLWDNPMTRRFR